MCAWRKTTVRRGRAGWQKCGSVWVLSRETAKLGYFWRHAYGTPRSGPFTGNVVNPDTGRPILAGEDQLRRTDFRKVKHSELVLPESERGRKAFFSPLWQADNAKIHRMASIEFIGRYMNGFFDYGIADEVHELKGTEMAQGNALGTLASLCDRTVILTGTLLGGYPDEIFSSLYRPGRMMREEGFDYGEAGVRQFAETYGVLEKVTTIEPSEKRMFEGPAQHDNQAAARRSWRIGQKRPVRYVEYGRGIKGKYFLWKPVGSGRIIRPLSSCLGAVTPLLRRSRPDAFRACPGLP
jgi:hypothetical protein